MLVIGVCAGLYAALSVCISLGVGMVFASDDALVACLVAIKGFTNKLFKGRNLFGLLLSTVIYIISIPAMLLLLVVQLILWSILLSQCVWKLGCAN